MPIGGGKVTTLAAVTEFAHLSVLGGTLYYIDGNAILSVPTGGGTPSFVLGTRLFPITALYALEEQLSVALAERPETPGPPTVQDVALVWGRADGGVSACCAARPRPIRSPPPVLPCRVSTRTGGRVLWNDQFSSPGGGPGRARC